MRPSPTVGPLEEKSATELIPNCVGFAWIFALAHVMQQEDFEIEEQQ
jgi:hypothetical protein